jgi:hypothetical protein
MLPITGKEVTVAYFKAVVAGGSDVTTKTPSGESFVKRKESRISRL